MYTPVWINLFLKITAYKLICCYNNLSAETHVKFKKFIIFSADLNLPLWYAYRGGFSTVEGRANMGRPWRTYQMYLSLERTNVIQALSGKLSQLHPSLSPPWTRSKVPANRSDDTQHIPGHKSLRWEILAQSLQGPPRFSLSLDWSL